MPIKVSKKGKVYYSKPPSRHKTMHHSTNVAPSGTTSRPAPSTSTLNAGGNSWRVAGFILLIAVVTIAVIMIAGSVFRPNSAAVSVNNAVATHVPAVIPPTISPTANQSAPWLTPYAYITGPAPSNTAPVPNAATETLSVPTVTPVLDNSGIAKPVDQVVVVTINIPTDSPTPSESPSPTLAPTNTASYTPSDTPTLTLTPSDTLTPSATDTLSRTDIAGTRYANLTATRQAYHDSLTATASAYLASRTAYYDNVTSTAESIYATRTELANEYAETATTYAENYVPPVPTSNYVAPTNAPYIQPTSAPSGGGGAPPGATALCNDGTYSYSQHRRGTCSGHGGVAQWLVNLPS